MVHGIELVLVDTPGLTASASGAALNASALLKIRSAYRKHKPDLVLFADRMDLRRQREAEHSVLRSLTVRARERACGGTAATRCGRCALRSAAPGGARRPPPAALP